MEEEHATKSRQRGLIRALLRDKHGSPFESGYFEFFIHAPRGVRDEHVRHRVESFSSSSMRYNKDTGLVYVPPRHRPLKRGVGFKQIKPVYEVLSDDEYTTYIEFLKEGYRATYNVREKLETAGFTETEQVRWITHDGLMVQYIARLNPRSLMHFLGLRTHDETANHVSFPMYEINIVATEMEKHFARLFPITYAAFNEFGREAP